jgi:hypothetical protein
MGTVYIRVPAIEVERLVSRCGSSIGMPGGIAHYIGFSFYDPPASSARLSVMHKRLADEVFRQFDSAHWQAGSGNATNVAIILPVSHPDFCLIR